MKSTDIKNWQETLPFNQIVELEDFRILLTRAVEDNDCMLCGNSEVLRNGLCSDCYLSLSGKSMELAICLDQHQVKIKVILPDKFPWEK